MVPFHVLHLISGINFLFLPTSFQSLTALHLITRFCICQSHHLSIPIYHSHCLGLLVPVSQILSIIKSRRRRFSPCDRAVYAVVSVCLSVCLSVCHKPVLFTYLLGIIYLAFSALTLLVERQGEHPACKNWVMRCWCGYLSGARCRLFAYGSADATASQNPIILTSFKSRLGLSFWYRLTIRYDTIRYAILTCAQKPTWASLTYPRWPGKKAVNGQTSVV